MTFREVMEAAGATRQQLESSVFKMAEECIAKYARIGDDTVRAQIDEIEKAMKWIAEQEERRANAVLDSKTQDAVNAFKQVLQAAKDILGEDVIKIPEVACALLTEGGYMGWRSIMGEAANQAPTRTASGRRI